MLKIFNRKKGFTLIELLVVIAIIGLLSSIVLVSMGGARKRARDARRQADLQSIMTALEMCYSDSDCGAGADSYPNVTASTTLQYVDFNDGQPFYVGPVKDPLDSGDYKYTILANNTAPINQYYCVFTKLEAPSVATWFCASSKGSAQLEFTGPPSNTNCCGINVTN
jgi:prepilin-type N-terminal cleavage/methylation domain-containing protein